MSRRSDRHTIHPNLKERVPTTEKIFANPLAENLTTPACKDVVEGFRRIFRDAPPHTDSDLNNFAFAPVLAHLRARALQSALEHGSPIDHAKQANEGVCDWMQRGPLPGKGPPSFRGHAVPPVHAADPVRAFKKTAPAAARRED